LLELQLAAPRVAEAEFNRRLQADRVTFEHLIFERPDEVGEPAQLDAPGLAISDCAQDGGD
jgi:hypothetical protein